MSRTHSRIRISKTPSWRCITASALPLEFRPSCGATSSPPAPRLGPTISLRQAQSSHRDLHFAETIGYRGPSGRTLIPMVKSWNKRPHGRPMPGWAEDKVDWGTAPPSRYADGCMPNRSLRSDVSLPASKAVGCGTASGNILAVQHSGMPP